MLKTQYFVVDIDLKNSQYKTPLCQLIRHVRIMQVKQKVAKFHFKYCKPVSLIFILCKYINPCDKKYNRSKNAVLRDGNSFLIDKSKKYLNKSLKIVLSAIYTNNEYI